jgi:hypothetical protein
MTIMPVDNEAPKGACQVKKGMVFTQGETAWMVTVAGEEEIEQACPGLQNWRRNKILATRIDGSDITPRLFCFDMVFGPGQHDFHFPEPGETKCD